MTSKLTYHQEGSGPKPNAHPVTNPIHAVTTAISYLFGIPMAKILVQIAHIVILVMSNGFLPHLSINGATAIDAATFIPENTVKHQDKIPSVRTTE